MSQTHTNGRRPFFCTSHGCRRSFLFFVCLVVLVGVCCATNSTAWAQGGKYFQSAPDDAFEGDSKLAYYGSENEWSRRQFTEQRAETQTKRRGQRLLLAVLDGQPQQAVEWCQQRLAIEPHDLETLFVLTIAYCELNQVEQALTTMNKAVEAGLPIERFLAGPRRLLQPLTGSEAFRTRILERPRPLLHGPMVGSVTDRSAKFWVRTAQATEVSVRVRAVERERSAGQNN